MQKGFNESLKNTRLKITLRRTQKNPYGYYECIPVRINAFLYPHVIGLPVFD